MLHFRLFLFPVLLTSFYLLSPVKTSCAASIDDLIRAVWGFDTAKAAALIDGGVDVNTADGKDTYPLILACSYKDNDEMIELLLSKGADINAKDHGGFTALWWARKMEQGEVVKFLKENGAEE